VAIQKLNYGGTAWHVYTNLFLGAIFIGVAIYAGISFHPLFYMLALPAVYFGFEASKWRGGGVLEERLRIRDEFIKQVQPKDGDRVLDVGTGGGLLAIGFVKAAKDVEAVGIDLWVPGGGGTSLKTAKRNSELEGVADRVEFKKADARNIPYPQDYFDIVVASFVIHMIHKDRDKVFQEMLRVLKPGGRFAIIEPPRGYRWAVDGKLKEKLETMGLSNVGFRPLEVRYPKKRNVYIIHGEKPASS